MEPPGSSTKIGHLICQSKNPLEAEGGTRLSGNPRGSELRARRGNLSQRDHSRKPSAEKIEEVRCLLAEAPGRSDGPKGAGFLGVPRRRGSFFKRRMDHLGLLLLKQGGGVESPGPGSLLFQLPGQAPPLERRPHTEAELMEECRGFEGTPESREWGAPEPASRQEAKRRESKGPPGPTVRGRQAAASLLEVGPLPAQEPPGPRAPSTWQGLPERLLTWFALRLEMRRQDHLDCEWAVCAEAQGRGDGETVEDRPCPT